VYDERLGEEDHMSAMSHLEYLIQVEQNPLAFSGRRILAAMLEKRCSSNGQKTTVNVVSLGTGEIGDCFEYSHDSAGESCYCFQINLGFKI